MMKPHQPHQYDRQTRQLLASALAFALAIVCVPFTPATPVSGQVTRSNNETTLNNQFADLERTPLTAEDLGLRMHLPKGSNVVAEKINDRLSLSISDDRSNPTWTMRIQSSTTDGEESSPAATVQNLISEAIRTDQSLRILSQEPTLHSNTTGELCFVQRTNTQSQPFITGWLVLPQGESTFLIFSIHTTPDHFTKLQPILETSFATIELQSIDEITSARKTRLDAGRALLESITPEKLKSLVGTQLWMRIYLPASPDRPIDTERGYALLEILEGNKSDLNPNRSEREYPTEETAKETAGDSGGAGDGFMVRVQGRIVVNAERNVYYDSIALYWMDWQQAEESWSIRGTHRQGEAERSEAETGVRTKYAPGAPPPKLTVIKADNATNSREPKEWRVPEVYLSQPLAWALPLLLPKDVAEKMEFAYYFYNFANMTTQVSQRLDVWAPSPSHSDSFTLTTRLTSNSQPIVGTYTNEGSLIRRVHADGSVTEPIELKELHQLWKSKGLRVGSSR